MMLFDLQTIAVSYVFLTVMACLAVMLFLWKQTRKRFSGSLFFVLDFAFQLAGMFLMMARHSVPYWASTALANTLILVGVFMGYRGLECFVGRRSSQMPNYFLLGLCAFLQVCFVLIWPNVAARDLSMSGGMLIVYSQCLWLVAYRVQTNTRPLVWSVAAVFAAYCLFSLCWIAVTVTTLSSGGDYSYSDPFAFPLLVTYGTLFIFLTYGLMLMFNGRLLMEISAQEEKFSKAFYLSPCVIVLTGSPEGRIMEANKAFVDKTGYSYADVIGKTVSELHMWVHAQDRADTLMDLTEKGSLRDRELHFRTKSGEILTGLLSAEVLTINGKQCMLSSISDITERKKMEDELKRNEQFIGMVMDNLPIGIAINSVDPIVEFSYMNDNFPRYYRTTREALTEPDAFWEAVYEDAEYRGQIRKKVLDDCASGDPERMYWKDMPLARQGKNTTFITARNIPISPEGLMISTVWDVTEQKELEHEKEAGLEAIRRLNAELEEKVNERTKALHENQLALLNVVDDLNRNSKALASANDALATVNKELAAFSYSVSHDLRAPLRSIDGFSSALLEDCGDRLDEAGKRYLNRIRRATKNMSQLIDDLLSLSRVTQSECNRQEINLGEMVREIAEAMSQKYPAARVVIDVQGEVIVRGDNRLMRIAMENLLDNAWKFTGRQEHPRIVFGATTQDNKNVIFLRDNGVGFDMNYAGKLFGAFQRLHRLDEFPGTGIGLATVLRIINRHGGQIWAESTVGMGATFYFTIPEE